MDLEKKEKYNFDKTYFHIKKYIIPITGKCIFCNEGIIINNDKKLSCPTCNGTGIVETGASSIEYKPRKCFLDEIITSKTRNNIKNQYYFIDENGEEVYGDVFEEIEDAILSQPIQNV